MLYPFFPHLKALKDGHLAPFLCLLGVFIFLDEINANNITQPIYLTLYFSILSHFKLCYRQQLSILTVKDDVLIQSYWPLKAFPLLLLYFEGLTQSHQNYMAN